MGVGSGLTGRVQAIAGFLHRFADASHGNVAMMFAIMLPVLVMLTMGGIDISRATTVRSHLQDALDAATLSAARSPYITDAELTEVGLRSLRANMPGYFQIEGADTATFTLNADQVVIADATVNIRTLVANIILPPYGKILDDTLPVGSHSEVNRSAKNIEVALVLDITGSMAGTRLANLKTAARQLVTIVVQDVQTPFYTRMSIVPYSTGVNLGSYATMARGAPIGSTAISGVAWAVDSGKAITGITRANPGVVHVAAHGFKTGDVVGITGVAGMKQINNKAYQVVTVDADNFRLKTLGGSTVNTSNYDAYSSRGTVQKCQLASCNLVITSNSHGLVDTDPATGAVAMVRLTGVIGVTSVDDDKTSLNDKTFNLQIIDANTFAIPIVGPTYTAYGSGGNAWCGYDGCQWRLYRNASNAVRSYAISDCATERVGGEKTSDASPSSAHVGRLYPNPNGDNTECPVEANKILPLTHVKADLNKLINDLQANGYTAGHIGLAWGWYTVSPNFNGLWSSHAAGPYVPRDTLKAVILMTDGEFNASYCSGVLARDAGYGGGERVNCNATNGEPFGQAAALCAEMKKKDIIIYTVGFQIARNGNAAKILRDCATSTDYAFLPASGADLSDDFAAIGRDITRLRISR